MSRELVKNIAYGRVVAVRHDLDYFSGMVVSAKTIIVMLILSVLYWHLVDLILWSFEK